MAKKTDERGGPMVSSEEYRNIVTGIRRIHRIARRLSRIPEQRLAPDMDTALDVDYINEWLDIILCRICGQQPVKMPELPDNPTSLALYQYCMEKARRQAGKIRWGLFTGQINQNNLTHNAWEGVDSVKTMLESSAMGAVQSRRWSK